MTGRGPDDSEGEVRSDDRRDGTGITSSRVREGYEQHWRSLRTLVGLLLLGTLLAALFAPPHPGVFLAVLVPSWLLALALAWYLVYRDGYERLRASRLYEPSVSPAQALSAFVVVAVVLKAVGTLALDVGVGPRSYVVDAALSVGALAVAYALVYLGTGRLSDSE